MSKELRKKLMEKISYDKETGKFSLRIDTRYKRAGDDATSSSGNGYRIITIEGKNYGAHRVAWLIEYGEWPSQCLDHINNIPTDNRIINLRPASIRQNAYNKKRMSNNKSGIKGVSFDAKRNKWCAYICIEGKQTTIGRFSEKERAAQAYRNAAIQHFGEYARL